MYGEEWEDKGFGVLGARHKKSPGRHRGTPESVERAAHESVGYCPGMHCKGRMRVVAHRERVSGGMSIPSHYITGLDRDWRGAVLLTSLALTPRSRGKQ